jgi:hypothetical protein
MKTLNETEQFILNNHEVMTSKEMSSFLSIDSKDVTKIKNRLLKLKIKNELALNKELDSLESLLTLSKYKNAKGVNKANARDLMVGYMSVYGKFLSLPHEKAEIEKMILAKFNNDKTIKFTAYEWELDIFHNLCKTVFEDKLPMSVIWGSISEAIYKADENEYSNLILDYCGILDSFKDEIIHAINNNIVELNGTISITLSKFGINNSKGVIGEIFKSMPKEMFGTTLTQTELGIRLFFSKILNSNYTIETIFEYADKKDNGNKGMDMILIVIKRIG